MRLLGVGDRPTPAAGRGRRPDPGRPAAIRRVLRVRRHVRGQERRHVGRDGRSTRSTTSWRSGAEVLTAGDTSCLMHIGGLLSRRRSPVRVMHLAEILASTGDGAVSGPEGRPRRPGPAEPIVPSRSFRGTPPFPEAARAALAERPASREPRPGDRDRSAPSGPPPSPSVPTGRRFGWPARRSRTRSCATCRPSSSSSSGRSPRPAAPSTGRATPPRRTRSSPSIARDRRRDRGRQGQVDGDPGDRAQRGAPPRGHRRLGDRPRRDDRPARPRPAVAHPRPRDPPQPDRDPRHLHRRDGPRSGGPPRPACPTSRPSWPRRPGSTCARSSCARASPSRAPTSPSPTPARSSSSNPRATAGCA